MSFPVRNKRIDPWKPYYSDMGGIMCRMNYQLGIFSMPWASVSVFLKRKGGNWFICKFSYKEVILESFCCRQLKITWQNFPESNAKAIQSHVIHY